MLYVGYVCTVIVALQIVVGLVVLVVGLTKPPPVNEQDAKAASWAKFGGFGERS